jgi:hypothetical protein
MIYDSITITLTQDEMNILRRMAQTELRKPKDQAAYMLRTMLKKDDSEAQAGIEPSLINA